MDHLIIEIVKVGGPHAALLSIFWYMLKDIRQWMPTVDTRLKELETSGSITQLAILADRYERLLKDHELLRSKFDATLEAHGKEFKAVWRRVGTRPEDKAS